MNFLNKVYISSGIARIRLFCRLLLLSAISFTPVTGKPQTVGNWTFNTNTSGSSGTFNTVSVADFSSAIPTKTFQSSSIYFGENGWPTGAINTAAYMEFTLTPAAGHALNLSSVILQIRRSNTGSSGASGPSSWSIRSSIDGFSADVTSGSLGPALTTNVVTLGIAFHALTAPVTFRVYGYNTTVSSGGLSRFVYENIEVIGSDISLAPPLKSFKASSSSNGINLSFSTDLYSPGDTYALERSTDARDFLTIHTFENAANSATFNAVYLDKNWPPAANKLFYRLRITDNAGPVSYSEVIVVKPPAKKEMALQIKQIGGNIFVKSARPGPYSFQMMLPSGVEVLTKILEGPSKEWVIAVPLNIKGLCFSSVWNLSERLTQATILH